MRFHLVCRAVLVTLCCIAFGADETGNAEGELPDSRIVAVGPDQGLHQERNEAAGRIFRDCTKCPEMVVVPAESFMMGSPDVEDGRTASEGPLHRVTMAEPFAAGVYEVTFEEWDHCVAEGGCGGDRAVDYGFGRGKRPVVAVSWDDAQRYVSWLSTKTGHQLNTTIP